MSECAEIDDKGDVSWSVIGKSPPNTRSRKKLKDEVYHTKHVKQLQNTIEKAKSPSGKQLKNKGLLPLGKTRATSGITGIATAHTQALSTSSISNSRVG